MFIDAYHVSPLLGTPFSVAFLNSCFIVQGYVLPTWSRRHERLFGDHLGDYTWPEVTTAAVDEWTRDRLAMVLEASEQT